MKKVTTATRTVSATPLSTHDVTPVRSVFKGRYILVIDAGWVLLAEGVELSPDSSIEEGRVTYIARDASVIREWGTTAGLGEIALNGPTNNTVLDPCGNPHVPASRLLMLIPCTY